MGVGGEIGSCGSCAGFEKENGGSRGRVGEAMGEEAACCAGWKEH
jgi:hypothetical protein